MNLTLDEVKDLIMFCKANNVTRVKLAEFEADIFPDVAETQLTQDKPRFETPPTPMSMFESFDPLFPTYEKVEK